MILQSRYTLELVTFKPSVLGQVPVLPHKFGVSLVYPKNISTHIWMGLFQMASIVHQATIVRKIRYIVPLGF